MIAPQCVSVRRLFQAAGLLLIVALVSLADEPKKEAEKPAVAIVAAGVPGNVFGDEEATFKFKIDATRAVKGRIVYRIADGTATVKHGEADVNAKANTPTEVSIKVGIPPVKPGVVAHWKLTASVFESDQKKASATFEQDLWVFPKDAFADRSEWLKKLKINLYDPKGDTAKVFTAAKIPFDEIKSVEVLGELKEGVVIVGEGTSFKEEKGLAAVLPKLAAGGLTVLILAPSGGEVIIPGVGNPASDFEDVCFRKAIVRKIDKRLDPDTWLPDGKVIVATVTVKMGEEATTGDVMQGPGGWPWIEARPSKGAGRWAFCGLAMIAKWDAGPTPRFLFAKMLEYLTESQTDQPKLETER